MSLRFTGLSAGEYWVHGNSPVFYPIKMPGLGKVGQVTEITMVMKPRT